MSLTARVAARLFDTLRFVNPRTADGKFHPTIAALSGRHASGVYAIEVEGVLVYVGSARRGTLYGTLTRHFQQWKRSKRGAHLRRRFGEDDATGYRAPDDARVAFLLCHGRRALAIETRWVLDLQPVENVTVPYPGQREAAPADDDPPF